MEVVIVIKKKVLCLIEKRDFELELLRKSIG